MRLLIKMSMAVNPYGDGLACKGLFFLSKYVTHKTSVSYIYNIIILYGSQIET